LQRTHTLCHIYTLSLSLFLTHIHHIHIHARTLTHRYLEFCLEQIVKDNEVGALITGLDGRYVEPGPGGDPIRNPMVLPTGKNIHALDPQSIPTQVGIPLRTQH